MFYDFKVLKLRDSLSPRDAKNKSRLKQVDMIRVVEGRRDKDEAVTLLGCSLQHDQNK